MTLYPDKAPIQPNAQNIADANHLADFIMMIQWKVILNLSPKLTIDGISFPQFFLLAHLANEEHAIMSDIAKKMGHTSAATTALVDRLEMLGYVERVHSNEDRRKIMVRITPKGAKFVAKKRLEISEKLQDLIENSNTAD